jgi:hypothetical protein
VGNNWHKLVVQLVANGKVWWLFSGGPRALTIIVVDFAGSIDTTREQVLLFFLSKKLLGVLGLFKGPDSTDL